MVECGPESGDHMGGTRTFETIARSRLPKALLAVGFLSLLAGTLLAYAEPATGYELSVYAGTPDAFWIGVVVALSTGLVVAMARTDGALIDDAAVSLGGLAVLTVILLPLVRGYYQWGGGDSLTHLGWTRDIVAGRLEPIEMLYPGIHTMTILVGEVLGLRFGHAQMIVVGAFSLVFLLFVTLCVRVLGRAAWAVPVGAFSALLLLPNNNVSVHLMAHPITQSLLFFPLVLYLLLLYVTGRGEEAGKLPVGTPAGVLLGMASVALVLLHPQGALNVVALLLTIAGLQFLYRRFRDGHPISRHRPVYVPTAVAVLAFALWAPRHPRVQSAVASVVSSIVEASAAATDEISQRGSSLEALGGGIAELFVKLFLVSAVFSALAAAVTAAWYFGYLGSRDRHHNALLTYVVASIVPLSVAFLLFFAASLTTQHFRYVGFLMIPVTILGAIGVSVGADRLRSILGDGRVRVGLVVLFLVLFPLPIATIHASPTIYQSSADVTRMELSGTETTVEYMDRDVPFAGVRTGPRRAIHGTYGTVGAASLNVSGERAAIPEAVFRNNLTSHYDAKRYVPVTRAAYLREVVLYEGFRYPASGFERLRTGTGVDRVHANGEYRLYVVGNESAS